MMRLWIETYAEPPKVRSSAVLSAVAHVALITASVVATANAPQRLMREIEARVQFLPPPDRVTPRPGESEALHYVAMPSVGTMGFEAAPIHPSMHLGGAGYGRGNGDQPLTVPVKTVASGVDSVFSVLEVDSSVTRYADSAAPSYPPDLLVNRVEGTVYTEYVVDTSGLADPASLVILRSTHPEFAEAVRDAMPYMHFRPAKFGPQKVRQLVAQQFTFRIQPTHADRATGGRSGNG